MGVQKERRILQKLQKKEERSEEVRKWSANRKMKHGKTCMQKCRPK